MKNFLRVFAILLVFALVFSVLEIRSRLRYTDYLRKDAYIPSFQTHSGKLISSRPGTIKYELDPFMLYRLAPGQQHFKTHINNLGLRGHDVPIKKPAGTIRIIITGGSGAYGSFVFDDNLIFSSVLEKKLRRKGYPVEIINAAIPGYSSSQELAQISHMLLRLDPDLLIDYTGFNDFYTQRGMSEPEKNIPPHFLNLEDNLVESPLKRLLEKSYFFSAIQFKLKSRIRDKILAGESHQLKHIPEIGENFDYNMKAISALADGAGIKHIIALQPDVSHRKPPCDVEKSNLAKLHFPTYPVIAKQYFDDMKRSAMAIEKAHPNTSFADLTSPFNGIKECIFIDTVHLNPAGHKLMAERLAKIIEKEFLSTFEKRASSGTKK